MCTKITCCFSCYLAMQLEKYLQYSIGIATEQSFRHMEPADVKIWISKNASLCRVLANRVTFSRAKVSTSWWDHTEGCLQLCVTISARKPAQFALASISRNTILKVQLKIPALPWYWTCSLSIIIFSYLLAFVQLTWQVNNG